MKIIDENYELEISLYHGTSSLFLNSICDKGLGGHNPLKENLVYGLGSDIYEYSRKYLKDTPLYDKSFYAFESMIQQRKGEERSFNWQHGDTYLSPSIQTAVRYAFNKKFGSELLSYVLIFLQELIDRDIKGVKDDLYQKYYQSFNLLSLRPSPILIEAKKAPIDYLLNENGEDPKKILEYVDKVYKWDEKNQVVLQQKNFRLKKPIAIDKLQFYLVDVFENNGFIPKFNLYKLNTANSY